MSSLLNAPSVQRDFGFEWDQVGESTTGVIRFNKQAVAPLRAALTSQSMCLTLCDDGDKCNGQLAVPQCNGNKRQKRDLFLTYDSLGEWEESLLLQKMKQDYPEYSEEHLRRDSYLRMKVVENLVVPAEFRLSKLAHDLNNEADLDRVHIKARTREESAINECLNPCTVRCFHFLHGGVDRQKQWEHLKTHHKYYFPWERDFGSESRIGKRPFLQGPTLNVLGTSYAGKQQRHMFRNFKPYRFFEKRGQDMVRRHMPRWWWFFPETGNWSMNAKELAVHFKDKPYMWPQEALYMPDFGEVLQSSRTSAYGPGVAVEASRVLAERFQDRYDKFYGNTNLTGILGCDPMEDKKKCWDISASLPVEFGFHAGRGERIFHPLLTATYFPAGQRMNMYMGTNSWMELLPGLSRAPEMINRMKEENNKEISGKVLPGFGISGNAPFSSQGFHHDNFISMSGSWVGAGGNMPTNKFNLLDDPHIRFQRQYSDNGLKYAALSYVSHQSSVVGSSASMDRRRDFGFVAQCQRNVLDKLFDATNKDQQRCLLKTLPNSYQAYADPRFEDLDESVTNCENVNMETCECNDGEMTNPLTDVRMLPGRMTRMWRTTENSTQSAIVSLLTIFISLLL